MLNHKVQQTTFSAISVASLDQQINDFMNVLHGDPDNTYIASPMAMFAGAGGYFYQSVVYSTTTPITILQGQ